MMARVFAAFRSRFASRVSLRLETWACGFGVLEMFCVEPIWVWDPLSMVGECWIGGARALLLVGRSDKCDDGCWLCCCCWGPNVDSVGWALAMTEELPLLLLLLLLLWLLLFASIVGSDSCRCSTSWETVGIWLFPTGGTDGTCSEKNNEKSLADYGLKSGA